MLILFSVSFILEKRLSFTIVNKHSHNFIIFVCPTYTSTTYAQDSIKVYYVYTSTQVPIQLTHKIYHGPVEGTSESRLSHLQVVRGRIWSHNIRLALVMVKNTWPSSVEWIKRIEHKSKKLVDGMAHDRLYQQKGRIR